MIATGGKSTYVVQTGILGLVVGTACWWATLQMVSAPSTPTPGQEIIIKPELLTPTKGATLTAVPAGTMLSSSFLPTLRDSVDGAAYYNIEETLIRSAPVKRLAIELDLSRGPTGPAQAFEFRFVQNGLKASEWYTFSVRPGRNVYTALFEPAQDHREPPEIDTIWLRGDSLGLGGSIIVHAIRLRSE